MSKNIPTDKALVVFLEQISRQLTDLNDLIKNQQKQTKSQISELKETLNTQIQSSTETDKNLDFLGRVDFFKREANPTESIITPQEYDDKWYNIYIENTGKNRLFFKINGLSSNADSPYIDPGEHFTFAPKVAIIKIVVLWSSPEVTTTFKLFATR